jgi:hypothetical protein
VRGSREYASCVIGSITSHRIDKVGVLRNGSITAVVGSGFISMSDELIARQPAIELPSNPKPSSMPSSRRSIGYVRCFHWPRKSTNFASIIFAPCFLT